MDEGFRCRSEAALFQNLSRRATAATLLGEPRIAARVTEQFGKRIVRVDQRLTDLRGEPVRQDWEPGAREGCRAHPYDGLT